MNDITWGASTIARAGIKDSYPRKSRVGEAHAPVAAMDLCAVVDDALAPHGYSVSRLSLVAGGVHSEHSPVPEVDSTV